MVEKIVGYTPPPCPKDLQEAITIVNNPIAYTGDDLRHAFRLVEQYEKVSTSGTIYDAKNPPTSPTVIPASKT
jgi:hypothetical protein